MPWPLPSAKNYGHDATMRGFRTERSNKRTTHLFSIVYETLKAAGVQFHAQFSTGLNRTRAC